MNYIMPWELEERNLRKNKRDFQDEEDEDGFFRQSYG
jgi:hypothetical protein